MAPYLKSDLIHEQQQVEPCSAVEILLIRQVPTVQTVASVPTCSDHSIHRLFTDCSAFLHQCFW